MQKFIVNRGETKEHWILSTVESDGLKRAEYLELIYLARSPKVPRDIRQWVQREIFRVTGSVYLPFKQSDSCAYEKLKNIPLYVRKSVAKIF